MREAAIGDRWSLRLSLQGDLRQYWPLWLVVGAAIGLRLYGMGRIPGILGDEGWYGVQVQRLLAGSGGALRTPTGNVPGIVQYGSLALLHLFFQPSAFLLRIPALLSSLAAMAVAYTLARRYFGASSGMAALVFMACLPVNLAYARLGWDPSHTGLLLLLACYAVAAERRVLSALAFAFALANHPAAVFGAPFLTLACLGFELDRHPWRKAGLRTAAYAALLMLAIAFSLALSPAAGQYVDLAKSLARIADPSAWGNFVLLYARLLSGDTVYRFIVGQGPGSPGTGSDYLVLVVVAVILVAGLRALRHRFHWPTTGLVAGWLASIVLLFLVAGPWALRPSLERFGIALIPATALALAVLLGRCFPDGSRKPFFQASVAGLVLPLLAGFWLGYLRPLDRGDARPGAGIPTGLPALNQAALEAVARRSGSMRARVVAEDWWIYWPIAYLAGPRSPLAIEPGGPEAARGRDVPPGGTYWIAYRGGALDRSLGGNKAIRRVATVEDRERRHALEIWWRPLPAPKTPGTVRDPA
jgi:hypothetical protein